MAKAIWREFAKARKWKGEMKGKGEHKAENRDMTSGSETYRDKETRADVML